jgi:RHS repeat-associated protein
VAQRYEYDAYGNIVAMLDPGFVQPYAFTGREWDPETGLYYYRARYYDPKIGRFMSEDPIRFLGGVNFYAYVENNPINRTDPFGLQGCCGGWAACYSRCVNRFLINPAVAVVATAAAGAANIWANATATAGGLTNAEVAGARLTAALGFRAGLITTVAEAKAAAAAGIVSGGTASAAATAAAGAAATVGAGVVLGCSLACSIDPCTY